MRRAGVVGFSSSSSDGANSKLLLDVPSSPASKLASRQHRPETKGHKHPSQRQRQRQRLLFLCISLVVILTALYCWLASKNSTHEEAVRRQRRRRQQQWAEEGLPLNRLQQRMETKKNNDNGIRPKGRQRITQQQQQQQQQSHQQHQQQEHRSIHPTSNIDTVVQYLTKLAEIPPAELFNNVLGVRDMDYGQDPFLLRELEEGKCPSTWQNSKSSDIGGNNDNHNHNNNHNNNAVVVEWLPPRPYDSMDIAKTFRENSRAYKSDAQGRRQRAAAARMGSRGYDASKEVVLWYEHISKAGGTTFCGLAISNMERWQVPRYHCMPRKGELIDGRVGSWTNTEFVKYLEDMRHGIVSNEWDPFSLEKLQLSGRSLEGKPIKKDSPSPRALFVTTLRDPSDRLLSAYTFFGLTTQKKEETNDDAPTFQQWISNNQRRLKNYTVGSRKAFRSNTARYNHITWRFSGGLETNLHWKKPFIKAVQTLMQHDLVLSMDVMTVSDLGNAALQQLLGWEKFEASGRGATGDKENGHVVTVGKIKNSNARAYFGKDEFQKLWEENWLDNILYLWCRAVFMVRLHCEGFLVEWQ